jgi:hypothetical protein
VGIVSVNVVSPVDRLKIHLNSPYSPLWIFVIALVLRAIPEFLSGPYPVGYDLLAGYAPSILALPDNYTMILFGWFGSPLAIYILWGLWVLTQVDLFGLLKVAGPVFYGLFAASFYFLVWKGLGWSKKKSFFTALIFLLQPAVLRTGWDQIREELGFMFFFILLSKTRCDVVFGAQRKPLTVMILSILIMLSHQLAAILFLVVVFCQVSVSVIRSNVKYLFKMTALLPCLIIFTLQIFFAYFVNINYSPHFVPMSLPTGTSFFAFSNYFVHDPRFVGGNYLMIPAYVAFLSLYTVVPLIPLAVKGYFRDRVFAPMMLWLLVASYSLTVFPWFALSYYWWWILLLPIPMTVYAGQALDRLGVFTLRKHGKAFAVGLVLLSIIVGGYASSNINLANSYMPSGLVESCVDFDSIPDIKDAFEWANTNLPYNATVIVPEKFQGFASMYSRIDLKLRVAPPLLSLNEVVTRVAGEIGSTYAIYFEGEVEETDNIMELESFKRVGIYQVSS